MLIVPVIDTPAQALNILLANQYCRFTIYQKSTGLFGDLRLNDSLICGGHLWLDRTRFINSSYTLFQGDFAFVDMQGISDPFYPGGLGTRFVLVYFDAADLAAGIGGLL